MFFHRKNLASVPPVVIAGTTLLSGIMRVATREIAAIKGVSVGEMVPSRRRFDGSTVTRLAPESRARVDSLLRLVTALDFEIDTYTKLVGGRLRADPGYTAIQAIPGVGPVLAAVFVAEIGDISRFARPAQLASWAGLTPCHHESDTTVHRGRITKQEVATGAMNDDEVVITAGLAEDDRVLLSPPEGKEQLTLVRLPGSTTPPKAGGDTAAGTRAIPTTTPPRKP